MQAIAIILLLALASTATEDRALLARIVSDPSEQQLVINAAKRSNVVLENACLDAKVTILDRFSIVVPLSSGDDRIVTGGSWKQSVRYAGCGIERLLNVQVSVVGPTRLDARPLLPGLTHANPTLQLDVFRQLVTSGAFGGKDSKCEKGFVLDTAVINRGPAAPAIAQGESWNELWTLGGCGEQFIRVVLFTPDSNGTGFTVLRPPNAP